MNLNINQKNLSKDKKIESFWILLRNIFFIFTIELIVITLISKNKVADIYGLIIGTNISILKLFWLEKSIKKSCKLDKDKATKYFFISCFSRQFLNLLSFFFVIFYKNISLLTFCIGLISLKLSGFLYKVKIKILKKR